MNLLQTIDLAIADAESRSDTRCSVHLTRMRQIREEFERLRTANEAADKYIDRLEDITWRGNTAAPDVNQCKRMYQHHKLQLHTRGDGDK